MDITYLGQSGFQIDNLVIDPFMEDNPLCNIDPHTITCDIICITHDHHDHIADVMSIAQQNNTTVVAIYEVANHLADKGLSTIGMNIGGTITLGQWKIHMVEAKHSCELGHPAGFVLTHTEENKTIYHAGDTALFSDMQLIGGRGIDVYMVPIGDRFTMGIEDAATSVQYVRPNKAIPMHYNTFPPIKQDPDQFKAQVPVAEIMDVGETLTV